jgi:DNA repair exonuclease SbcCD ATPase subunit
MPPVNPIILYGLVELVLVMTGVAVFFMLRNRRLVRRTREMLADRSHLEAWLQEETQRLRAARHSDATVAPRLALFYALLRHVRADTPYARPAWERLVEALERLVEGDRGHAWVDVELGDDLPAAFRHEPQAGHLSGMVEEQQEFERLLTSYQRKAEQASEYRHALDRLKEDFERTQTTNQRLLEALGVVIGRSVSSSEAEDLIRQLDRNQGDLRQAIVRLDAENKHLGRRLLELDQQARDVLDASKRYKMRLVSAVAEKMSLRKALDDAQQLVDKGRRSYDSLYRRYKALRREYVQLYNATHQQGQAPA